MRVGSEEKSEKEITVDASRDKGVNLKFKIKKTKVKLRHRRPKFY